MYSVDSMDDQTQNPTPINDETEMSEEVTAVEEGDETKTSEETNVEEDASAEESQDSTEETSTNPTALNLLDVESIIKRHLIDIEKLQGEIKDQRAMFEDSFNNDANYKALADKAKEATRQKNALKQQLLKTPAITELDNKIKSQKEELSDLQQAVSDYLLEYQRLSGSNQFETDNGDVLEIVQVTKLVRKSKYRP